MGSMSVSVPEDLKARMAVMDEVNWSAVARKAFEEKVKEIELVKHIVSKSRLTEKDALMIGRKITKSMARKFRSMEQ